RRPVRRPLLRWLVERCFSGPRNHCALRRKSRSVARTIPGALRRIPGDDATHMCAGGVEHGQPAFVVARRRHLLPVAFDDFAFAALDGPYRTSIGAGKSI